MTLSFEDEFNLSKLKHLAERSLNNPQWTREPDYVLIYLKGDETWPARSELRDLIDRNIEQLKAFRRYANRVPGARRAGNDAEADRLWEEVMADITALIDAAEEKHGGKLRVWR